MELTDFALEILKKRYLRKDDDGKTIETPAERFWAVAKEVASAERLFRPDIDMTEIEYWADRFFKTMANLEALPSSPVLMNAGKPEIPKGYRNYCACTVLPVPDDMAGIGEALKEAMLLHKTGSGTGFNFSSLRPKGWNISTTKGKSSGPIAFMRVFNEATNTVSQGGVRRGANMGIMEVWHPDIKEFINAKRNPNELTNFNISVGVWDDFMEAVEHDQMWDLHWGGGRVVETVRARELFDMIVECAWETGEPGLIFLSRINEDNPTPEQGPIRATNPCGEAPLYPYEACNLASVNLYAHLDPKTKKLDWEKLLTTVHTMVRFLDNVIELTEFPVEAFYEKVKQNRKIGLGVMGFADVLLASKIPYDHPDARALGSLIMSFISRSAEAASCKLFQERGGRGFPTRFGNESDGGGKMRNAIVTTIAPTGSIARIAGVSHGIEPLFDIVTINRVVDGEYKVLHPALAEQLDDRGIVPMSWEELPDDMKQYVRLAHHISPEDHVLMQSAFQKWTHNAVSKTVNLPHDATKEVVARIFKFAWKEGCKGITVYRDGCRANQPISGTKTNNSEPKPQEAGRLRPAPVLTNAPARRVKVKTGCGDLYFFLVTDEAGNIKETFCDLGHEGGCECNTKALSMTVSALFRCGVDPHYIVKLLRQGKQCNAFARAKKSNPEIFGKSCADAMGIVIEQYLNGNREEVKTDAESMVPARVADGDQCPECGGALRQIEGCVSCSACGYSKCN